MSEVCILIPTCRSRSELAPMVCDVEGCAFPSPVIATCVDQSASLNRNAALAAAPRDCEYIVMLDDDVRAFYPGFAEDLVSSLRDDDSVYLVSARLVDWLNRPGAMMFMGDTAAKGLVDVPRVPTAAIAFRARDVGGIRFDENFVGSGYEDDDFCAQLARKFPGGRVVIDNRVRLVHINEQKNQGGINASKNKAYFDSKWTTVKDQRFDKNWNIPKIIHFVWVGPQMPEWEARNIEEFRRLNPEYKVVIHDDSDLLPAFRKTYDSINSAHPWSDRSDLVRYSVLLNEGGWYFDCDFWPFLPVDEICTDHDLSCGTVIFKSSETLYANGIIGCRPHSPGITQIVEQAVLRCNGARQVNWGDLGTTPVTEVAKRNPAAFKVLASFGCFPYEEVNPRRAIEYYKKFVARECLPPPGAYCMHLFAQGTTNLEGIANRKYAGTHVARVSL